MAITDSLLGDWPLDDVSPHTIFDSYRGMHLQNRNGSTITQGVGHGEFNGTSAGALSATNAMLATEKTPDAGTFYAEVFIDTVGRAIAGCYATTGNQRGWLLSTNGSGVLTLTISDDGTAGTSIAATGATLSTATWYKVLGVWDGATATVYVDGVAGTPVAAAFTVHQSNQSFRIGYIGEGSFFDGNMRNVRFWNRALSVGEISGLFDGTGLPTKRAHGTRNIVLVLGQSNGLGATVHSTLSNPAASERHYHNCWTSNRTATLPLWSHTFAGLMTDTTHCGPEMGIADLLDTTGKPWGIIKYAVGGTGLDDSYDEWEPTGTGVTYEAALVAVQAALDEITTHGDTPVIKAIVWDQGENEAGNSAAMATSYRTDLAALIVALRAEYGAKIPVIVQRMSAFQTAHTHFRFLQASQDHVARRDPNVYLINNDSHPVSGDNSHYTAPGQVMRGRAVGRLLANNGQLPTKGDALMAPIAFSSPMFLSGI